MPDPALLQSALDSADRARASDDEPSWEELLWHLNALAQDEADAADADYWARELYPIA
jgi:hypothetical protein